MVKAELISGGRFDEMRAISSRAVGQMLGFTLMRPPAEMSDAAIAHLNSRLATVLGLSLSEIEPWIATEAASQPIKETAGHILIATNFIERAVAYFERRGVAMRSDRREGRDGRLSSVSIDRDVDGLLLRLIQA